MNFRERVNDWFNIYGGKDDYRAITEGPDQEKWTKFTKIHPLKQMANLTIAALNGLKKPLQGNAAAASTVCTLTGTIGKQSGPRVLMYRLGTNPKQLYQVIEAEKKQSIMEIA